MKFSTKILLIVLGVVVLAGVIVYVVYRQKASAHVSDYLTPVSEEIVQGYIVGKVSTQVAVSGTRDGIKYSTVAVPGVKVTATCLTCTHVITATTDGDGKYSLTPKSKQTYSMKFEHIGYNTGVVDKFSVPVFKKIVYEQKLLFGQVVKVTMFEPGKDQPEIGQNMTLVAKPSTLKGQATLAGQNLTTPGTISFTFTKKPFLATGSYVAGVTLAGGATYYKLENMPSGDYSGTAVGSGSAITYPVTFTLKPGEITTIDLKF